MIAQHERDASAPGHTTTRNELAEQWARLTWVATLAGLLLAPVAYVVLQAVTDWSYTRLLLANMGLVVAVRGGINVILHRFIPWPTCSSRTSSAPRTRTPLLAAAPGSGSRHSASAATFSTRR